MAKIKQISSSTENYSILPVPFWGWAGCSRRRGRCTAECTDTWLQVTGVALNQSINSLLNLGTGPESIKESRTLLSSTLLSSTLVSRPSMSSSVQGEGEGKVDHTCALRSDQCTLQPIYYCIVLVYCVDSVHCSEIC